MPHLQHISLQLGAIFLHQRALHALFRVTGEQHLEIAIMQHHDQAGVVDVLIQSFIKKISRRQHLEIIILAQLHRIAGFQDAVIVHACAQILVQLHGRSKIIVGIAAVINILHAVLATYIHNITHMVRMMVGNNDRVDTLDARLV